jgi:hypothetical protein
MSFQKYINLECCNSQDCVSEDESFTPLSLEDSIRIRKYFNDPVLDNTIKYIYECHGDSSGNMIYVGGLTENETFCIYIKNKSNANANVMHCKTLIEYVEYLAELDKQLFNIYTF